MTQRVAVFIDWQNVYMGARNAFHEMHAPARLGMVQPTGSRSASSSPAVVTEGSSSTSGSTGASPTRAGTRGATPPTGVSSWPGRDRGPRAEVAAWTASRLRVPRARLWCHYLPVEDYRGVDPRDYTTP
jgi:hypothetical protein